MSVQVSSPNTDLPGSSGTALILNNKYPFAKLDSTNSKSFQVINLLFLSEPANPDGIISFYQRTLVYQFAHGYTHVPSTWFEVSIDGFTSALGTEGVYLTGGGTGAALSSSVLIVTVDSTNVNFYIDKYYDNTLGVIVPPAILGTTLTIRSYCFVNDLLGNDVPSQA